VRVCVHRGECMRVYMSVCVCTVFLEPHPILLPKYHKRCLTQPPCPKLTPTEENQIPSATAAVAGSGTAASGPASGSG
jgi:hypothetical protein